EEEHDRDPHGVNGQGEDNQGHVPQVIAGSAIDGEVRHQVPAPVVEGTAVNRTEDHARDGRVDEENDPEPEGDHPRRVAFHGKSLHVLLFFQQGQFVLDFQNR
ncbi:hypothetical protein NGA_2113600, partial [Nannochloropsis gaditana CCMP526]|uniref:uncharacterized protein n=1 Tax=Nannochloropsis gaditana (strain CCMP526) TaxID=1093141 RepID=UPI00029F702D